MVWIWPMMMLDQAAMAASTLHHHLSAVKIKFTNTLLHLRATNESICTCIEPVTVNITSLPRPESISSQLQ